jgi:hypothetical protein
MILVSFRPAFTLVFSSTLWNGLFRFVAFNVVQTPRDAKWKTFGQRKVERNLANLSQNSGVSGDGPFAESFRMIPGVAAWRFRR